MSIDFSDLTIDQALWIVKGLVVLCIIGIIWVAALFLKDGIDDEAE